MLQRFGWNSFNYHNLRIIVLMLAMVFTACSSNTNSESVVVPSFTKEPTSNINDNMSSIVSRAEEAANEDDYEAAYDIIVEGIKEFPNSQKLNDLSIEYKHNADDINNIIYGAEECVSGSDYNRALEMIDNGLSLYPKSKRLKSERESIANRKADSERSAQEAKKREKDNSSTSSINSSYTAPSKTSEDSKSKVGSDSTATSEENKPVDNKPTPDDLPHHWSGSYMGNTVTDAGDSMPTQRLVWLELDEINGTITGTCKIGQDNGSQNIAGSFKVEGTYDRETREVSIWGTDWIDQGELWGMRNFWGTVNQNMDRMGGMCKGTNSGQEGEWSVASD